MDRPTGQRTLSPYFGSVTVLHDGKHVPHADQEGPPKKIVDPHGYVGQRTLSSELSAQLE